MHPSSHVLAPANFLLCACGGRLDEILTEQRLILALKGGCACRGEGTGENGEQIGLFAEFKMNVKEKQAAWQDTMSDVF